MNDARIALKSGVLQHRKVGAIPIFCTTDGERHATDRALRQPVAEIQLLHFSPGCRHDAARTRSKTQRETHMKRYAHLVTALVIAGAVSGCATIIGSPTQLIPIASNPSDASIVINDEGGAEIFKGMTPTTVTLPKSTGKYWGGKSFTVKISKAGFAEQTIPVTSGANGWYIAGNLVFGGLIGWFIVDPLSGSMYTLSPEAVNSTLNAKQAHNNNTQDGSISIVLLQDVPSALHNQMQRVN